MPANKKQKDTNTGSANVDDKNRYEDTVRGNKSTAVNEGNPTNTNARDRNNRELHTKNSITGSDSDGQAD